MYMYISIIKPLSRTKIRKDIYNFRDYKDVDL